MIRCTASLRRPAEPKAATWSFVVLPKAASAKLPTRGQTSVHGTLNGAPFKAILDPDGAGSHWLKVPRRLREAAGLAVSDTAELVFEPTAPLEPSVPADLRKALASDSAAKAAWHDITPKARADWILWITTAKKAETRARRIENACDMLGSGKRRVCCFDRSGLYSKGLGAPRAAE